MMFMFACTDCNPVCSSGNQVDGGSSVQGQMLSRNQILQFRHAAVQQDGQFKRLAGLAGAYSLQCRPEAVDAEKTIAIGESKVFLQQAIALEQPRIGRSQSLLRIEAFMADQIGRASCRERGCQSGEISVVAV